MRDLDIAAHRQCLASGGIFFTGRHDLNLWSGLDMLVHGVHMGMAKTNKG